MFKTIIPALLLTIASGCVSQAQPTTTAPDANSVYAWYKDDGLAPNAKSWKSAGVTGDPQTLNQVVGAPRITRVKTPTGEKNVLSLDGSSALWQRSDRWKEIKGDLSVVALVKLKSLGNGFLFDGSSGAGLTRAQVRGGQWQIGSQPVSGSATTIAGNADNATQKAIANVWQTHAFVFRQDARTATHTLDGESKTVNLGTDSPLSGFIIGANGAAKDGLRADVAELMVFDRALSDAEIKNLGGYLKAKWGTPETVGGDVAAQADKTALSVKLSDKSKPLIWVWAGQNTGEGALKTARNEPQNFAERVRWEMGRRRDIVIDTRTHGATAGALDKNFEARVARFRPAVVVLQPGEGDDAAALIERVRKLGAIPVVQSDAPPSDALRRATSETGAILVETPLLAAGGAASADQIALNETLALMRALGIDAPNSSLEKQLKP